MKMMRSFLVISSLVVGAGVIFQKRYKLLNMLLAVTVIRRTVVAVSMNLPYVRNKILPSILGRSAS
ncbi:hypothetical protein NC661_01245 [Aquibacillus koreensis]|uniref:Uncharacterized protein n=2 Tax=Aquibacillus koreensis TaxID=279446 RepID=A0A9X3WFR1_9BACI|nr:hypothetical protein [Aquibacillus koreensis]MCT2537561.1 hypothetical protein [Aquibacillus koreensis]MDC3419007.1 hypothetical protein [Aquibacillus koreensis]